MGGWPSAGVWRWREAARNGGVAESSATGPVATRMLEGSLSAHVVVMAEEVRGGRGVRLERKGGEGEGGEGERGLEEQRCEAGRRRYVVGTVLRTAVSPVRVNERLSGDPAWMEPRGTRTSIRPFIRPSTHHPSIDPNGQGALAGRRVEGILPNSFRLPETPYARGKGAYLLSCRSALVKPGPSPNRWSRLTGWTL